MAQTIALQTQTPLVNVPAIEQNAQQSALNDQKIQEGNLNLQQANRVNTTQGQQFSALQDYNAKAGAGDPNAIHALDAQPQMQKDMYETFDGLPPAQRLVAAQRAADFGGAAQRIAMFPPGSDEQKQAWATEINQLAKNKDIPPETADNLIKSGPNNLLLQQATTYGQWAKTYAGLNGLKIQETAANIVKAGAQTDEANARADYLRGAASDNKKAGAKYYDARAKAIADPLGLNSTGTGVPDPTDPTANDGQDNPAEPQNQADYDAIPKGTQFVNPKDGQIYVKQ